MTDLSHLTKRFNNTYVKHLPEVLTGIKPTQFNQAKWLVTSPEVADLLEIDKPTLGSESLLSWLSGNLALEGAQPIAQKYTGHQFGHYNPDLGDGRGILLGELETKSSRWDIHVKGAGKTPYSRFGDGRAVLRSCIREFLASEALHHLGIPTSRALGIHTTSEPVQRETIEQGAVLVRVAESHIRFGHFEYAFHQSDTDLLKRLVHYVYDQVLPLDHQNNLSVEEKAYLVLQYAVTSTASMIAKWQALGFCHGVMNTDNMSILGITFDFGPYGFLDEYNPGHICNHSDHSGRYAYDEQPSIGLWNLNVLAHSLSPLIERQDLEVLLKKYEPTLLAEYSQLMRSKLGLATKRQDDRLLLSELLALMQMDKSDYTNTWRLLSKFQLDAPDSHFVDHFINREMATSWLVKYKKRAVLDDNNNAERQALMLGSNPKYILRNYLAQEAIEAAEQGDISKVETLFEVLKKPYEEQQQFQGYAKPPPDWSKGLSISCSS